MNLQHLLTQLGEPETLDAVRPYWQESCQTLPPRLPAFLEPEEFTVSREWASLEPNADATLRAAAERIAADAGLLRLAWHCHQRLHEAADAPNFRGWPTLERALGGVAGAFYLLVALSIVPKVRALHARMGVAEQVTRDTMCHLRPVAERYAYATGGLLGIDKRTLYWYRHHLDGDLFRVGRMEYMIRPFRGLVVVYRNPSTGETLALAPDRVRFLPDGQVARASETEGVWTSTLREDERAAAGYAVSPAGMATRRWVTLPKTKWRRTLGPGDLVLQMHIPGGGGMTPARCEETLCRAMQFFRRHFPNKPFKGIECGSWIFNTQLQEILPDTANLVRFQRELYLFPTPSNGNDGLYFIFCRDDIEDWSAAPRDTSLRRAVADFLAAGNRWRGGGMFILNEDVPAFGSQHYLSQWPPSAVREAGEGISVLHLNGRLV